MEIIATCAAGIEGILGNELKHLGYHANVEMVGRGLKATFRILFV